MRHDSCYVCRVHGCDRWKSKSETHQGQTSATWVPSYPVMLTSRMMVAFPGSLGLKAAPAAGQLEASQVFSPAATGVSAIISVVFCRMSLLPYSVLIPGNTAAWAEIGPEHRFDTTYEEHTS